MLHLHIEAVGRQILLTPVNHCRSCFASIYISMSIFESCAMDGLRTPDGADAPRAYHHGALKPAYGGAEAILHTGQGLEGLDAQDRQRREGRRVEARPRIQFEMCADCSASLRRWAWGLRGGPCAEIALSAGE